MYLYYCTGKKQFSEIRTEGIRKKSGIQLFDSLKSVRAACGKRILVIDTVRIPVTDGEKPSRIPPKAILNLDPYRPPRAVKAGGGYVVRKGAHELELLLIFRRGVWDLPKGKRNRGETMRACALREVSEETGLRNLRTIARLPKTVHTYPRNGRFEIKKNRWYVMQTDDGRLIPQAEEEIEAVVWTPWSEARDKIKFKPLRAHMAESEPRIFALLYS